MTTIQLLITAIFSLCVFSAGVAAIELSGFFPAEARPQALRQVSDRLLIGLLAALACLLAGAALWVGIGSLPWSAVIIAGGLALVLAPMGFELVPKTFWDSRAGVTTMVVVTGCLVAALANIHPIGGY